MERRQANGETVQQRRPSDEKGFSQTYRHVLLEDCGAVQCCAVAGWVGDSRKWRCFRRDIRLPNGDVVVAGAQILANEGAVPDLERDIDRIKAILGSIRALESR